MKQRLLAPYGVIKTKKGPVAGAPDNMAARYFLNYGSCGAVGARPFAG